MFLRKRHPVLLEMPCFIKSSSSSLGHHRSCNHLNFVERKKWQNLQRTLSLCSIGSPRNTTTTTVSLSLDRSIEPPRSICKTDELQISALQVGALAMWRRPVNRRSGDSGGVPFVGSLQHKSRASPLLSVALIVVGALLLIGYSYSGGGSGGFAVKEALTTNGGVSCTLEVQRAIPVLMKAYGDSMSKVLHVGPETCSVVSKLLKEEKTEAWGVEPYDLEDADSSCKSLVHKGLVRVADIKFPLPYRPKTFSLVVVSDALDYLSPKYLNKTLLDFARVSMDGLIIFTGSPGQQRAKVSELPKFGRPAKLRSSSWWIRYFVQTGLEENEDATKKFEQAASKQSYHPGCQVFHLSSNH